MKYLLLLSILIFSCENEKDKQAENEKEIRRNFKATVEKMSDISSKIVLFRILDDSIFFQLNAEDGGIINREWYYNHMVGDTVSFDYLRKERFFVVRQRPDNNEEVNVTKDTLNLLNFE